MNLGMETITKPRELFVPNSIKNRPAMFDPQVDDVVLWVLTEREYFLLDDSLVFCEINDEIDTLIDGWEEEEIPYEKIPGAIKVVRKKIEQEKDQETISALMVLLQMLELAYEKKTLLGLYL